MHAELAADLDFLKTEELAAETAAEVKAFQSIGNSVEDISDGLLNISLPQENPAERTRRYVETCDASSDPVIISNQFFDTQSSLQGNTQRISRNDSTDQIGTPRPRPHAHSDQTYLLKHREVSSISGDSNVPPSHIFDSNPTYHPVATPSTGRPPTTYEQGNPMVTAELTQFLLKKELLLTRLNNFNDQPEGYASWKAGFLGIVRELKVTAIEEIDLLVKWLGPNSVKHALSLRASNVNNPERGLKLIWDRLDERFGSPEMVEAALKLKLERFPKLTNKDHKQLYEVSDILSEIESAKEDEKYKSLLAYFDSSSGIIPIVSKLPYGLQEKWTNQASKYKKKHNVSFPPFPFFVEFVREVSRTKNDPSFAYDSAAVTSQKKDRLPTRSPSRNSRINISSKKTEVSQPSADNDDGTIRKCPLHKTNHTLNECQAFRTKTLEDRKKLIKEYGVCFRCCSSTKHMSRACKNPVKCAECSSDQHATALHVGKTMVRPKPSPEGLVVGGENADLSSVNSKCTQICGSQFSGKSCSNNVLVNVYPRGFPEKSKRMYAILDEQSNVSLARSDFFDLFDEHGQCTPYTLSSCNGRVQTSGRRAKDYVVEALDASGQVELPVVVECDHIPDIREEIPTPEVALCHSHLADIAKSIPPVDKNSQILLLIGRDVPVAHHVLSQRIGPHNSPYAQRLRLGWVIVGETCLGKAHKPDYTVNKTYVLKNGRPSLFAPCSNELDVRDRQVSAQNVVNDDLASPVFITTETDNKIGTSVEDREFLQVMDEGFVKGPEGNWVAPLPFRKPRRRLPNNKGQAIKRAKTLHNSLLTNTLKRQHFFDFMQKIFDAGHAELAPPMKPEEECWYLPLFGVYHPKKPDQIRGVFDSSATHEGISLNDVLLKGPDLTNSLLGILLRFRKEPIAVTADIERMFYNFHVREDHRNYLRFLWYQDNDFENHLVDYRMKVHVFGNSPSPAVATYGLRKAAEIGQEEFGQDVVDFVNRDFYVDDALMSLPTAQQAIDLLKRTQQALATGGNIRVHKIVSNSQEVIEAFPLSDHAKDIKNLDLGMDTIPLQRSLGLSWDLSTDSITFQVSSEQRPFSRRGVLSTINSLFDPIGFVALVVTRGKVLLRELMTECRVG